MAARACAIAATSVGVGRISFNNFVAAEPLRGSPPNLLQGLKNLENLFVCLTSSNQIAFIGHAS